MKAKIISMVVMAALCAMPCGAVVKYKLGVARYTMWQTPFDKALDILQKIDCHYMSLIEGSIPQTASAEEIAAYKAKLAKFGIEVRTAGPLYYSTEAEARQFFTFAKNYGLKYVSVVPYELKVIDGKEVKVESDKMIDVLEKLVKEFGICAGIHNHGPDIPYLYPTAEAVWARIKDRDARIGFCFDVGHQRRAGNDPVQAIRKYASRIYDVHLKNIKIDPVENFAMPGPRGELDIPGILKALEDIGYAGICHIEYEKDFNENLVPLAESMGYYRGVIDTLKKADEKR